MRFRMLVLTLVGCLLTAPLPAGAQPAGKVHRVGMLIPGAPPATSDRATMSFLVPMALGELGYVEGRNLLVERRFAGGKTERLPGLARELVQLRVDVIVAVSNEAIQADEGRDEHDPHRHDRRSRGGARVRRKPCPARRKHHRGCTGGDDPGRQASGTPQGSRPTGGTDCAPRLWRRRLRGPASRGEGGCGVPWRHAGCRRGSGCRLRECIRQDDLRARSSPPRVLEPASPSRSTQDHRARGNTPAPRDLPMAGACGGGGVDGIREQPFRTGPAHGDLR